MVDDLAVAMEMHGDARVTDGGGDRKTREWFVLEDGNPTALESPGTLEWCGSCWWITAHQILPASRSQN